MLLLNRSTTRQIGFVLVGILLSAGTSLAGDKPEPQPAKPVLTAQLGHLKRVHYAVFSPDGKQVLTASEDGTARLWETATGLSVRRLGGHTAGVNSAVFSADGKQVLTASNDKTARLWETATGEEVRPFVGHTAGVNSAVFSADGKQVLTASNDKTARLWETATGEEVRRFVGHASVVYSATFSPDGKQVLTASGDKTARLWETATGKEVRRLVGHTAGVNSAVFSRVGKQVLTASDDKTACLWETARGQEVRRFVGHASAVYSATFSPDGKQVLTASWDKTVRLWETATGNEVRQLKGHGASVFSAVFSPDGKQVLTASDELPARLWETDTGKEIRPFEGHAAPVRTAQFSPDGAHVLTMSADKTMCLWATEADKAVRYFSPSADVRDRGRRRAVSEQRRSTVFSPDGKQVLTTSDDKTARLWETATGKEVRRFVGHASIVYSATFSPDGKQVLTASWDKTARLWEAATGQEVRRFEGHTSDVYSAVFSRDGKQVLTASYDNTARLWETATGKEVLRFEGHSASVLSAVFSPDGRQVLTSSSDTTARLWETATGREHRRFEGHLRSHTIGSPGSSAVFSPDGKQVLTKTSDNTARLWETDTGKEVRRLTGHTGRVNSAVFSPDGKRVLTASEDGTARLWESATGRELCSLISYRDGTTAVADPAGRFDASNSGDIQGLYWVLGMETISLDQLKARYYEPGLLAKILGHNTESLRKVAAFMAPRLYPDVQVKQQDGKLQIALKNRGGGIGKVVVMVNGKERTADARGPKDDPAAKTLTLDVDLTGDPRLLAGEVNLVEVFAYNDEGYLRSRGRMVRLAAKGEKRAPELWAVIAGVSDYRGDALDLKFASKDATDFAAALKLASSALFGAERTHVTLLTDVQAGRKALDEALIAARKAQAGDILVIYLAGHGVNVGDSFYYLTADAQSANLGDPALRAATALSSSELSEAIKLIPALKQVLVLDTCASGKMIEDLTSQRSVPSSQVRALDRVKDRTGMYVLAGCASDRVSYEATQYGQGLLTYSLLLGMKGGQLRDREYVDVSTLFNFAADRVPEFAKDIGGVQRPIVATPRGGSSFDIGRLTDKDKESVRLNEVRPLFVRATFLDDDEGADVLALSDSVNDRLNDLAAKGGKAALVFVDVSRFPGAFKIAGKYVTKDGTTTVRFKLRRGRVALTDWIEVSGKAEALPARIVAAARKHLR